MIISGGSRSNGGFFARHLTNDRDGNDRAELCEMDGVSAHTVDGFFRETAAVASGTRCKNYFYHANINPRDHEHLTPKQWREAVDTLEKNLGLEGQPRFVMEHEKDGRTHRHVIWSRINIDTMRAISDRQTAKIHERTSRELEIKFDLVRGKSVLEPGQEEPRARGPKAWENFRGGKSGIDPKDVKAELTELWRASDTGQAFKAAIEARGYQLARGDRRDFVVLDHAGDDHSLARRLDGVKTAEMLKRMADVDLNSLPSVEAARTTQRAKYIREGRFDLAAAAQAFASRPARSSEPEELRKVGSTSASSPIIATDHGGMVAQQREANRMLARRQARPNDPGGGVSRAAAAVTDNTAADKTASPSPAAPEPAQRLGEGRVRGGSPSDQHRSAVEQPAALASPAAAATQQDVERLKRAETLANAARQGRELLKKSNNRSGPEIQGKEQNNGNEHEIDI